jgi:hypothetical protein
MTKEKGKFTLKGRLKTYLTIFNRLSIQKTSKTREDMNDIINTLVMIGMYRIFNQQ